jgi:hypothetical protein
MVGLWHLVPSQYLPKQVLYHVKAIASARTLEPVCQASFLFRTAIFLGGDLEVRNTILQSCTKLVTTNMDWGISLFLR